MNVQDIKNKIEKMIEDEDRFEKMLMEKYPSLFNEVDGKPVPPECGISCPLGWEKIVEDLCGAIHERTNEMFRCEVKKGKEYHLKIIRVIRRIKSFFYKHFNPYKGMKAFKRFNSPKEEEWAVVKKRLSYKINHGLELITIAIGKDIYEKVPASPPVKIAQVKEKFGTLRFYYDGGDDTIRGMVEFAEYLSSKTCQETGNPGSLHVKSKGYAWYATLSPKKAKELGYKQVSK